ncbi:MAG: hydrogenase expression/formation protein HypE [Verrucomicrobiae bacterium]|nr:hydrogenase expression/formation protein HypE [Verrucomicrobiae bacterium]
MAPAAFDLDCPVPLRNYPRVLLAHGGGGRLMHDLIATLFTATFANPILDRAHDAAVLDPTGPAERLAFTTDSYVVRPLFFPGGDIGSLAVHGTVNDLAMAGARPRHLSAGFIIEEGLPMETLWRVVRSMRLTADRSGVAIVTGDTKVVDAGRGDGLYLNTAGLGIIRHSLLIEPRSVVAGDAIVVSGDLGRHGMAVMAVREGLQFDSAIESDSAPVASLVLDLLDAGIELHCLRDLTRGGLAGALNEIAATAALTLRFEEASVPVRPDVRAACEILGLDVLQVACEGRFVAFVPQHDADRTVECLRRHPDGTHAARIGTVLPLPDGGVRLVGTLGVERPLPMPGGEQLPRIC